MASSFRTEINLPPARRPLTLKSRVLTLGSCFAEVMGHRMEQYKVATLVNPFGTIYNPLSLFRLLQAALVPAPSFRSELVERDGLWFAYDLHSAVFGTTQDELVRRIHHLLGQTQAFLRQADTLILTLGTAVGYVHRETNQLVANCHKIPQRHFEKKLLDLPVMATAFAELHAALQAFNPDLQIVLTLSPVRHLKETLELNSVSKGLLRVLCHQLASQFPLVSYFPAYEIMLDDLRDYRFYQSDLIHPTELAEDYIWDKFKTAYFDQAFIRFTGEWDKIRQALDHRPFHPESEAHQLFLQKLLAKLEALMPLVDCRAEIARVKSRLT